MRKLTIAAFLLFSYFGQAQNTLLNADFWKKAPNVEIVKAEIQKGNNPSEANRGNHDVVSIAINNNAPLETIIYLIGQEGNSVSKNTHDGRTYLHWAASRGNADLVKYLLEKGSDINRTDDKGAIPISFAASNGQTNTTVYDLLFKAGNNPKQKFQNGASLLLLSIANDADLKLADYFISKGLSWSDVDDFKNTAFDYASRSGNVELLKKIAQKGVKHTNKALIFASQGTRSQSSGLEAYQYLIDEVKIKPNVVGDQNENVLHNLVRKKDQNEIIAYFLQKGVDINQANKEGNTVLMEAAKGTNADVLQSILSKTKNINQVNAKGETALAIAVNTGSADVVSKLLENKADTKVVDKSGNNLAYYLIQSYKPTRDGQKNEFNQKMELLKNNHVDFVTPQKDGNTLYHLAVVKNDVQLLNNLEGLNIDINTKNSEGITALHKAALIAKDDVVLKYLIAKGAKKDAITDFDETVYDLANENESLKENNISIDFLQ
ncbi:ankyrin repeat domain-containing protein [Flavobacterium sp. xlx-214]|uniref:ankyrin repeat domain-containing protein n=1 Tax=unclassified Flavobacterium TaxID=196869 RepID=UPI0013D85110|nr:MULTISPECIES: ankyrin repeat domain-containing protein [unclassified Flavobacterium]MBA5793005.1 ankyrin repeat domain-containing protein [Flavobacterium sp. xlx-221]QMI84666.1 ankyrin repeat domain-containing protein [Flavobacterium sp. xlx-214]